MHEAGDAYNSIDRPQINENIDIRAVDIQLQFETFPDQSDESQKQSDISIPAETASSRLVNNHQ